MRFNRILVPLDGSALAEAALWKATEFADGGTLCLLRAAEVHAIPGVDLMYSQAIEVREAEEYLASTAARLRGTGVNVETQVWYGPPAAAIIEGAEKLEADLIVISSHGRSGLGRLALGSVAEAVLRSTRTPILLLHAERADVEAQRATAPARERRRRRPVTSVVGTEVSSGAARAET